MPFVKLDCGMVDSTIICEPGDAFKAWIILLLKAGPDGVAHITPQVLAMFCGCTVERMEAILTAFAGPDKSSKTKDHGGARIKITDDGYLILNYTKYRAKDYSSTERSRRFRSKCNAYATDATPLHTVSSVTGTQAEAEADIYQEKDNGRQVGRFADFWKAYPRKVKKRESLNVWKSKKLDLQADALIADIARRLQSDDRWKRGFIPDPPTYLRGERWQDEIATAKQPGGAGSMGGVLR